MEKDQKTALYEVRCEDELIYVGISDNPKARRSNHSVARTFPDGSVMTVSNWYDTMEDAQAEEARRIKAYRPKFNIVHNESGVPCAGDRPALIEEYESKEFLDALDAWFMKWKTR